MIQKIRNSILLKFLCFVLIILFVLSGTFYTSYLYVRQTTQNYAETLAESLLRQSDNAISLYEENLRYNAESLYRSIVMYDLTEDEKDIREARISSYYSQIAYKNREIAAAIFYDNDMNTVVSLGKPVDMPSRQAYIRTGEDLNADRYFADSDEYYYAFYYPIYDGTEGSSEQLPAGVRHSLGCVSSY